MVFKMRQLKNLLIFCTFSILLFDCKNKTESTSKGEKYNIQLLVRGPGECVYQIFFNKEGNGKIIRGKSKDFYKEPFKQIYTQDLKKDFKIAVKTDLDTINLILDSIAKKSEHIGGFYTDSSRKELYVDGKLKIDVYSIKSVEINRIMEKLKPNLPVDINYFCE